MSIRLPTRHPTRARFPESGDALGTVFALVSAFGLGLAMVAARFAYEGGTNGLTIATIRSIALVVAVFVYCRLAGRSLSLGRTDRRRCMGLGLLMAIAFYGPIGAVEFIPTGLAVLLFYIFPPLVALIQAALDRVWPAPHRLLALACAFAGLAAMLGASFGTASPLGMALALSGAIAVALNSVGIMRLLGRISPLVSMFHMVVSASITLVVLTLATGSVDLPVSDSGWAGLFAAVVLQCISLPLYFVAISRIGALKSAMLANIQPVTTIIIAAVVLGEILDVTQLAGGAIVLASVIVMQRYDARARRQGGTASPGG